MLELLGVALQMFGGLRLYLLDHSQRFGFGGLLGLRGLPCLGR
jgi:hypothetical protein